MKPKINIYYVRDDFSLDDFANEIWSQAESVALTKYWSGDGAPPERAAEARLLWTDADLLMRFDCAQHEPLIVSQNPQINIEAKNLWERDVCEIFIAPDLDKPEKYYEFEVAPTGEWLDYAVTQLPERREIDSDYNSGMRTAVRIFENSFSVTFAVGWEAFGKKPKIGDRWLGNLFRCVGTGVTRGYLAWQPTLTVQPNFHIPQVFGALDFQKKILN